MLPMLPTLDPAMLEDAPVTPEALTVLIEKLRDEVVELKGAISDNTHSKDDLLSRLKVGCRYSAASRRCVVVRRCATSICH